MRRAKRAKRRRRGLRLIRTYAEGIRAEYPRLDKEQVSNLVWQEIETDFEDRPILALLIELLKEFLPLILDGLFDD